jgi:hypothetical protein
MKNLNRKKGDGKYDLIGSKKKRDQERHWRSKMEMGAA